MILPGVKNPIVYLCSEFAIDSELPTYAGGLGILAGDIMHEAALQHHPFVGIGILYKGKEFLQHITGQGLAETRDSEFDHDTSFLRPTTVKGKPLVLNLDLGESTIKFKSYHLRLSDNTVMFFLSTDVEGNPDEWISDMDALYRGDMESQMRQQILLGIGSIKLLGALKLTPALYHINEGRPEFIIWQIVTEIMKSKKVDFQTAWDMAKNKIVYTNHTLVSAGNISYPVDLVKRWASIFSGKMGVDAQNLVEPGLIDPQNFSTTLFALNISHKQSAVSKIHAKQAKKEWPNYDWITITNGVNMSRWQDSDFRINSLDDRKIWDIHMIKKRELMNTVAKRTGFGYDPERLVVTWARRLAEYKQPKAIFTDLARLSKILTNPERPVQLLFAGNSHTADPNSISIINEIIKIFSKELNGYAIFVPNYNIALANHLTSGSDLWLNTPQGTLEACGTSGMKAISNGVVNCTVIDGWTYEVDWTNTGWVLDPEKTADSFYNLLENEISPLYYSRDNDGLPKEWIERMRRSILLSKKFSTQEMFEEYKTKLYSKN